MSGVYPIASGPISSAPSYVSVLPGLPVYFPNLPGLGWPIIRTPFWASRKQQSVSGKQFASSDFIYPRYVWELPFNVLREGEIDGEVWNEMETLLGLYLQVRGGWGAFLYKDQDDNSVTDQFIAAGNGVSTTFPMLRTFGNFSEPVKAVDPNPLPPQIYLDGIQQPGSAYSITTFGTTNPRGPGWLIFSTPPGDGVLITGTFSYFWLCRFLEDQCEFDQFDSVRTRVKKMTFKSVQ